MTAPSQQLFVTFAKVAKAIDDDASAKQVHKLRTTARRLEALTNYLPEKVIAKHEDVIDEIQSIRKKSGKVRDLDVQLSLLSKVSSDAQRPQFEVLENRLLERRERRTQKLYKEVRLLQRKKWLNRLERFSKDVKNTATDELKKGEPLKSAKERLKVLAARYPDRVSMVDPEELHQLRIELKKIRYTAELAGKDAATKRFTAALEKHRTRSANGMIG